MKTLFLMLAVLWFSPAHGAKTITISLKGAAAERLYHEINILPVEDVASDCSLDSYCVALKKSLMIESATVQCVSKSCEIKWESSVSQTTSVCEHQTECTQFEQGAIYLEGEAATQLRNKMVPHSLANVRVSIGCNILAARCDLFFVSSRSR